jgi:hypothetical protein
VSAKGVTVALVILFFVAVAALAGRWALEVWLPQRAGEAVAARFGDDVKFGDVRYVFPLALEFRDVVFPRRPGSVLSGAAPRVRVDLRPSAVLLGRFDGRLLRELTAEDYTIYLHALKASRPERGEPRTEAPAAVGDVEEGPAAARPRTVPRKGAAAAPPPGEVRQPGEAGRARAVRAPFDFGFRGRGGRVVFRGERGDAIMLREADVEGRVSAESLEASLDAVTTSGKRFAFSAAYSFLEKAGSAEYRAEALEAVQVLRFAGKPRYLLEGEGNLALDGTVTWRGGKVDHRAAGRLSEGRLVLAPGNVRVLLEDVDFRFGLDNAAVTVEDGSCRAGKARWHFAGRATDLLLDVTFRSENMTFQNLADMFAGEGRVEYPGAGVAEFHIGGSPEEAEFYVHVERTDKR